MTLNTDLLAATTELRNLDLLRVEGNPVVLTEQSLVMLGLVRLILSELGGLGGSSGGGAGAAIDYSALADAIAAKTLTVTGDTVNESVLATAIAPTTYLTQLTTATIAAIADAIAAKTLLTSGSVSVSNFPATQAISGTVAFSNNSIAISDSTTPANKLGINNNGQIGISNFPATQVVSGGVSVNNLPTTQSISGNVSISNFPSTQPVSGTVTIGNSFALDATVAAIRDRLPAALVGGKLLIDGSGVTQPVSLASLPAIPAGGNTIGAVNQAGNWNVNVANFPTTQAISGTVALSNSSIAISDPTTTANKLGVNSSGQIGISNFPTTQAISGSVSISNFPATQPVSGTVTVGNNSFAIADATTPTNKLAINSNGQVGISNFPATQTVSGSVSVSNFPATQTVSGTVAVSNGSFAIADATTPTNKLAVNDSGQIGVSNFPATQAISGSVSVSNFPTTQPISGTVAVSNGFALDTTAAAIRDRLPTALVSGRLLVDGSGVTQPVSLASLPALATGSNVIGSVSQAGAWNVSVSNFPATQAVSLASLPVLPAGSNTIGSIANTFFSIADNTTPANKLAINSSGQIGISNFPSTQAISASSLPLPTGAATSAKQPALGTAGTASADVITVQGIASMTALKVDGSATTQPVSLASLPALATGSNVIGSVSQSGAWNVSVSNFPATQPVSGTVAFSNSSLAIADATTPANKLAINGSGQVGISNFPATQAVSATTLPLPTGAATSAKQPALGTAGAASVDVITVQGIASMTALKVDGSATTQPVSLSSLPALATGSNTIGSIANTSFASTQSGNWNIRNQDGSGNSLTSQASGSQRALDVGVLVSGTPVDPRSIRALTSSDVVSAVQSGTWTVGLSSGGANSTVSFSSSTTSGTFTLSDKYAIAQIPSIAGAPTITLQVSLDGSNWASSSVSVASSASVATLIESDSFARVVAAIGLSAVFRFSSSASITATITIRQSHA